MKICGLMRGPDVKAALDYGADATGFVAASAQSPRNLSLARARKLMRLVHQDVSRVTVTAALDSRILGKICSRLRPNALQLHRYDLQIIRNLRKNYPDVDLIIASAIRNNASLIHARKFSLYADAVLADTPSRSGMGGTGRTHDWRLSASLRNLTYPRPMILAGGLTPENVQVAIRMVRPYAVDVSTGVESRIGVKDHGKIKQFVKNAKGS